MVLWWLFVTAAAGCASVVFYARGGWPPIRSDGFGYYAYLPSVFLDGDLEMRTPLAMQAVLEGDHPPGYAWSGLQPWCDDPVATGPLSIRHCQGPVLDKYTAGTAVLEFPFFIAAHLATVASDPARATGYSTPYQIANIVASVFYLGFGAMLILVTLRRYHEDSVAVFAATLAVFATSVFNYATCDGSFSHIYSFAAVAALLLLALEYRAAAQTRPAWSLATLLGATLGLVAMIRVPNVVVGLLLLVLWVERLAKGPRRHAVLGEAVLIGGAFAAVFLVQAAYWHSRTGSWLVNSYSRDDPGFNWLSPHLLGFAFGVRKGLFFWAPCLLAVFPGLAILLRRDRTLGSAIGVVLAIHLYVCASWWSWWFGAGYGSRPFVDVMPLAAVPLAASVGWVARRGGPRIPLYGTLALVMLNLFLTMSYWRSFVPGDGATIADLLALPSKWATGAPGG